jgi:GNAT superfamily N-acetyltransferase
MSKNESGLPQAAGSILTGRRTRFDHRPGTLGGSVAGTRLAMSRSGLLPVSISSHAAPHELAPSGRWQELTAPRKSLRLEKLTSCEIDQVVAHFRRLDADDSRTRFGSTVKPGEFAYLGASSEGQSAFGFFSGNQLAALAQIYVVPQKSFAEAAFSVEAEFRRQHLASDLMQKLLSEAWKQSLDGIFFQFMRTNTAMLGLARSAGASLQFSGEDVTGHVQLRG